MQSDGNMIFVGIKIDTKLRDLLDASNPSMKPFFDEDDPAFLKVSQFDGDEYIGKAIASGTSLEILGNLLMNVKSMLKMICPTYTPSEGAIKIFALTEESASAFRP